MTTNQTMNNPSESDSESESESDASNSSSNNSDSWKDADFLSFKENVEEEEKEDEASVSQEAKQLKGMNDRYEKGPLYNPGSCKEVPPWITAAEYSSSNGQSNSSTVYVRQNEIPLLTRLHNEIIQFYNLMKPRQEEVKERLDLVEQIRKIVYDEFGGREKVQVEIFGSLKTGLFLPSSDIDLVLKFSDDEELNNDNKASNKNDKELKEATEHNQLDWKAHMLEASGSRMSRFAKAIQRAWLSSGNLSYLEVIGITRVPIVKLTHSPSNINVDISFEQRLGHKNADFMNKMIDSMPPLKPLVFVLKAYTAARGLNEPYSGGVGSFLLQLMIISFIQHRCKEEFNRGRQASANVKNLGSMLLEFLELYGIDFNYCTTGISVRNDGFYFAKGEKGRKEHFFNPSRHFMLGMENPDDPSSDVGVASFRIGFVQRAFEASFKVLLAHVSEPEIPTKSILGTIIPTNNEMIERAKFLEKAFSHNNVSHNNRNRSLKKRKLVRVDSDMETSNSSDENDSDNRSEESSRYQQNTKGKRRKWY